MRIRILGIVMLLGVQFNCKPFTLSDHSLVFVYLGEPLPAFIRLSIAQARLFNLQANIFFIANKTALDNHKELVTSLEGKDVIMVESESLSKSSAHAHFDKVFAERPGDFGPHGINSYWKFTTERFFYIHELMEQYNLSDTCQIECDVMIYFNVQEYLPLLHTHYPCIAAPFETDTVASMSFTYFANASAASDYAAFIADHVKSQYIDYDMRLLANYKNSCPGKVAYLPTCTREVELLGPLKSSAGDIPSNAANYWNHIEDWNSIFDCDYLGTYLEHKRWNAPRIIFMSEAYSFIWKQDHQARWVPYAIERGTLRKHSYRINTLHIAHKGNLALYQSIGSQPPLNGA